MDAFSADEEKLSQDLSQITPGRFSFEQTGLMTEIDSYQAKDKLDTFDQMWHIISDQVVYYPKQKQEFIIQGFSDDIATRTSLDLGSRLSSNEAVLRHESDLVDVMALGQLAPSNRLPGNFLL